MRHSGHDVADDLTLAEQLLSSCNNMIRGEAELLEEDEGPRVGGDLEVLDLGVGEGKENEEKEEEGFGFPHCRWGWWWWRWRWWI